MKGLLLAFQFLTIIPVRLKGVITERDISRCSFYFPVVGMAQGLITGGAVMLLLPLFNEDIVAALALLVLILTNGGFHLDGLADTFDAVAVKSTGDRSADRIRRLDVMKDSTTGAIGVTAIAMALLLKYLFISSLLEMFDGPSAAYIVMLMALFSKWTMLPALFHGRSARSTGLGKLFLDGMGPGILLFSTLITIVIFGAATLFFSFMEVYSAARFLLITGVVLYVFAFLWSKFCLWRFGGMTGDTMGAAGEISDLLFLGAAYLLL